jgi:hypothetical protein
MILLKKPYKPVMFTGLSAQYNVYGRSFYKINAVYLSGAPLSGTTFYNPFSGVPKLSANYPGFTARKLLSSQYFSNNDNTITVQIPAPIQAGYIDVIAQNQAGYGKLTQYVIKEPYSSSQPLSTLRPWMHGVNVLSEVSV